MRGLRSPFTTPPHPALRATFSHRGRRKVGRNRSDHTVDVFENLVVPEAQDSVAFALEEARALRVVGGVLGVLTAIGFNDQPCGMRAKIREVAAHRDLLAELRIWESFP